MHGEDSVQVFQYIVYKIQFQRCGGRPEGGVAIDADAPEEQGARLNSHSSACV